MKLVALTSAAALAATTAFAGNLNFEAPAEPEVVVIEPVEETGSMGGSGAWIVPVVAVGLIALAVSESDHD